MPFFLQNYKISKNFNRRFFYILFFKNVNQFLMSENFFSKKWYIFLSYFKIDIWFLICNEMIDWNESNSNWKNVFLGLTDLVFLPLTFFQQNCLRPYILENIFVWHCFVGRNICTNFTLDWNLVFDLWPLKIKSLTST